VEDYWLMTMWCWLKDTALELKQALCFGW